MKLLIIEDDENKRSQLLSFLGQEFPDTVVETAASLHSGVARLTSERYDLVLLDMTMPTFDTTAEEDGGRPQVYGGRSILRQMDRRELKTPVIVVTQFDLFGDSDYALTLTELDDELSEAHPNTYCGSVYYNATMESWKGQLRKKIVETLAR